MKYILYLLTILICINSLPAQMLEYNISQMLHGEDVMFYNAEHLGRGGSGLAGGSVAEASYLNPALLSKVKTGFVFNFGSAFNKLTEDRSYPYYDSFVGFNDYGSYSFNSHWYQSFYGSVSYHLQVSGLGGFAIGTGFQPFKNFSYNYVEEVRDPFDTSDKLLGYNSIGLEGVLNEVPLSIAIQPLENLATGIKIGVLSGSIDYTNTVEPKTPEHENAAGREKTNTELDNTPMLFSAGFTFQLNERLTLGAVVNSPYTIKSAYHFKSTFGDSADNKGTNEMDYPLSIAAGLEYKFQNVLAARINVDFEYEFWSRFKDSNIDGLNYYDTFSIRTGIEHNFFDKIPLRAGFYYSKLPQSKDFSRTVITAGSGIQVGELDINFAGGVSSFKYYQDDLFPDSVYGFSDRSDSDRVQLTSYFVRISFNYHWPVDLLN